MTRTEISNVNVKQIQCSLADRLKTGKTFLTFLETLSILHRKANCLNKTRCLFPRNGKFVTLLACRAKKSMLYMCNHTAVAYIMQIKHNIEHNSTKISNNLK